MKAIDTPSSVNGHFSDGTPALGYIDGTIMPAWWCNQVQDELLAILAAAGVAPDLSGVNTAQVIASLTHLFGGGRRIGAPMVFDGSGSIQPVNGAALYIIEGVGGGGSGGSALATSGTQGSAGGGASAGAYGKVVVTAAQFAAASNVSGLPLAIGAGGAVSSGFGAGNDGTATNVGGGLLLCPPGHGGLSTPPTPQGYTGGAASSSIATTTLPAGQLLVAKPGAAGGLGIVLSPSSVVSGVGGSSEWGTGGDLTNGTLALMGNNGSGKGSGGSGGACIANAGTGGQGGAGMPGRVIVTAFS